MSAPRGQNSRIIAIWPAVSKAKEAPSPLKSNSHLGAGARGSPKMDDGIAVVGSDDSGGVVDMQLKRAGEDTIVDRLRPGQML